MSSDISKHEWLYWFDRYNDDASLINAANVPGKPIDPRPLSSTEESCQMLNRHWEQIFVAGPQHVKMLRMLIDSAKGFARTHQPNLREYNRQRSLNNSIPFSDQAIYCITGLAGVSKSSTTKALSRICELDETGRYLADGQNLALRPVRRISISSSASISEILKGMANPIAMAGRKTVDLSWLMAHLRDWFQATATSSLVVDEMQFFTQSSAASTRTVQLIMTLAALGVPIFYVANYSLVRKLMKRPHEEKDRLLSNTLILEPPRIGESWWVDVVKEYLAVLPGVFLINAHGDAHELHQLTAGLFRILKNLLLQAYRDATLNGDPYVRMSDVRAAYRGRSFSSHRKDVEDLKSLSISNHLVDIRSDLVSPFDEIADRHSDGQSKKHQGHRKIPHGLNNAPAVMIESTISKAARSELKKLRKAADDSSQTKASVTRIPSTITRSAQDLRNGASLLNEIRGKAITKK